MPESASPGSDFLLSKWYLDCVSSAGETFIGYAATLSWKSLKLAYASTLRLEPGGAPVARSSIRAPAIPVDAGGRVSWRCRPLGIEGCWLPASSPIERTIYSGPSGFVRWRCLQPRAGAEITGEAFGGRKLSGVGYVEHLEITALPWLLPIRELHWGRFHSERETIVWIDWRGSFSTRLIFRNEERGDWVTVEDHLLESKPGGTVLRLVDSVVLREGVIGSTALRPIPRLRRLLPFRILQLQECKWRSRAVLNDAAEVQPGWAIHEVVRWPDETTAA